VPACTQTVAPFIFFALSIFSFFGTMKPWPSK
jgi:hypothetical protein